MLASFLPSADSTRALATLGKLSRHDISAWALTGGIAVELYAQSFGAPPSLRALSDIDFVVESFDQIPATLAEDFIFRHVHPFDPPDKTILQFIDPESAVRVDVFRGSPSVLRRAHSLPGFPVVAPASRRHNSLPTTISRKTPARGQRYLPVVSLEDLLARLATLTLPLAGGISIPSKHAQDFQRLENFVAAKKVESDQAESAQLESAWAKHRKEQHPTTFAEARNLLQRLIPAHPELLVTPSYSTNIAESCPRCVPTTASRLADPTAVLQILGYC